MRVPPCEVIKHNGKYYRAGDILPDDYAKKEENITVDITKDEPLLLSEEVK